MLPLTLRSPEDRLEDHVDRMIEAGAKAARVLASDGPSDPPVILKPFLLGRVYERLQRHRAPLLLEGAPLYRPEGTARYGLEDIDAICSSFPDLPVILLRTHRSLQTQLACISHHPTAEARDTTARTSLRLLAVLNVLFKYACARQAARASS